MKDTYNSYRRSKFLALKREKRRQTGESWNNKTSPGGHHKHWVPGQMARRQNKGTTLDSLPGHRIASLKNFNDFRVIYSLYLTVCVEARSIYITCTYAQREAHTGFTLLPAIRSWERKTREESKEQPEWKNHVRRSWLWRTRSRRSPSISLASEVVSAPHNESWNRRNNRWFNPGVDLVVYDRNFEFMKKNRVK